MGIIFKKSSGWKWQPDSDEVNAAEDVLLRADNTIPDELGALRLRRGSRTIYSGLDGPVHSLYTAQLQGNMYRVTGALDSLYINGEKQLAGMAGVGDLAFADDAYQVFMARDTLKKKWDGETLNNWGIPAPDTAPTLSAIDAIKYTACNFDATDLMTINEGASLTPVYVANYDASQPAGALSLQADAAKGRASMTKKWATNEDFLNFLGNIGGQTDLFDMRIWMEDPRKVDKITIMFGMSTGTDPFLDDYYYFDFNIRNTGTVNIKDAASNQAAAYGISNAQILSPLKPQDITRVKSPSDAGKVLQALGRFAGSRSRERADTSAASPAWGHLSVTRGQFNRVGGTPGRDWKTVRGFKVVYSILPGSTEKIYVDDAIWTGGGNRALTGSFQVGFRFARRLLDKHGAEVYTELSPMSPISKTIVLQQQTLEVIIPAAQLSNKDPQVNQIWVYMYGGWLDTYYRVAVLPALPPSGMTIDDISDPNNLDDPGEWARLSSYAFTYSTNTSHETPDLRARIFKSELETLIENEVFEAGSVGPPDNIVSIAGPWNKRVFALTEEGWLYPSSQRSPSSFSLYQTLDLRQYGEPMWVVKTTQGVFVGLSKDIVMIAGSGDVAPDNLTADLYPVPLNIANPPVDRSIAHDGNMIYYRSSDGLMQFAGSTAQPLPYAGTSTLWKGFERYGIPALDIVNGRFRYAMYQHNLFVLVPEGINPQAYLYYTNTVPQNGDKLILDTYTYRFAQTVVHVGDVLIGADSDASWTNMTHAIMGTGGTPGVDYLVNNAHPYITAAINLGNNIITFSAPNATSKLYLFCSSPYAKVSRFETACTAVWKFYGDEWRRFTYGLNTISAIHRDYDGSLTAGTLEANVLELETGELDSNRDIYVEILTPYGDGGQPMSRKDPADLQVHAKTGGSLGTLNLYTDASEFPNQPTKTLQYATQHDGIYRLQIPDTGAFVKAQVEFLGNMSELSFHGFGVTYVPRPEHVVYLNLGTVMPEQGADVSWINQVELELISDYNVYLDIYKSGLLHSSQLITVNPGVRDVYTVQMPRDTKGRRLHLYLRSAHADGEGFVGFETYMVRIRHAATGNVTELYVGQGDQRSDS